MIFFFRIKKKINKYIFIFYFQNKYDYRIKSTSYGCEWININVGYCVYLSLPCVDATLTTKNKCISGHNELCFWNSEKTQGVKGCTSKSLVDECGEILTNGDNLCNNGKNIFNLYELNNIINYYF
jgi:hypothetical protein